MLDRQIVVRVPQFLYDLLAEDAEENGRTIAQSVRWHLAQRLATAEGHAQRRREVKR